ncbi:hypothetical protein WAI453_007438 [Rhynchosporium graminicola]
MSNIRQGSPGHDGMHRDRKTLAASIGYQADRIQGISAGLYKTVPYMNIGDVKTKRLCPSTDESPLGLGIRYGLGLCLGSRLTG